MDDGLVAGPDGELRCAWATSAPDYVRFRFVGPTTACALMQACGLVNDHLDGCVSRPGAGG